ncbi:thiopeptide-type bacteriocin biosynthesis protein [Lipingzhangella halophila]|uniref:Thiopeptide-type bacteriocin biosynthesis protein n=1 Tax=Lipingzhangella halophila TaxID=1783352 RepID=A0A7W7W1E7_9ACTN|nr:lantibiotic dehydratase [Lipingzhangella halophila]MBB4930882.1 thiopeptide-type bacteriocin biosynthesis protein [Lipingzhangella halophila]
MNQDGFGLLRAPLLSVEEVELAVAEGDTADPLAGAAVDLAADPSLRGAAAHDAGARSAVLRYLARMGGRATPFGLFAGTAPVSVNDRFRVDLGKREQHVARVRVDAGALEQVVAEAADQVDARCWPLRANPLLRWVRDGVCFPRHGDASSDVVRVRCSRAVTEVLRVVGDGEIMGADAIRELRATMPGFTADELASFLNRLVETGMLERSLGLVEPGVEPAERAAWLLERMGHNPAPLRALVDRACGPRPLDTAIGADLDTAWETAARALPALSPIPRNHRFDLHTELSTGEARVDRARVSAIRGALLRVAALHDPAPAPAPGLDFAAFRDAFRDRYDGAEVPLLEAVDLESGVLPNPYRGASELAGASGVQASEIPAASRCSPELLRIYADWAHDGSPADISGVTPAGSCGARAALAALVGDDHPDGLSSVLVGGTGRSPYALLARFGLHREDVERHIRDDLADADTEAPEGGLRPIHAELVYHAGGRIGNVLVRPRILAETVALSGAAGGTLPPHRLTLQLRGDEFLLRDRGSGRPVIIELNTAHNLDLFGLDPVYTVLGHLASSGSVGWSWGALALLPHLPRVTCGPVVVAPERWKVPASGVREVLAGSGPAARLRGFLPGAGDRRWVGIGEYDHILPVDLRSDRSVEAALSAEKRSGDVTVVEMPQMEAPAVRGPRGRHVGELVLPLGPARRGPPRGAAAAPHDERSAATCAFDIARGRRWAYARYYCGHASADTVIARARKLAAELRAEGVITGWFFLRYQEGGYHVRVRMRPTEPRERFRVVGALDDLGGCLQHEGLAGRTVLEDYVPEVARYGGAAGLEAAERLFDASSEWTAGFAEAAAPEDQRLYQGVADALGWCSALFNSADHQLAFLDMCKEGLGVSTEKRGNPLGKFARAHEGALRDYLDRAPICETIRSRVAALSAAVPDGRPPRDNRSAWPVLGSVLHMHCNRMFAFDAVRMEYLVHEMAGRTVRRLRATEGRGA